LLLTDVAAFFRRLGALLLILIISDAWTTYEGACVVLIKIYQEEVAVPQSLARVRSMSVS
jgi:hypothetical protein